MRTSINANLEKKLATYFAAAGAAGVSMLALAQSSEAKVIYTPTYHRLLGANYSLDLNHDGVVDFIIRSEGGCSSRAASSACYFLWSQNASSAGKGRFMGSGFASALRAGAQIGPAAQFNAVALVGSSSVRHRSGSYQIDYNWLGPLANNGKGVRDRYVGLKFNIGPESHYGWLRISVGIPNPKKKGFTTIITGYAYETEANKAIVAGQTSGSEKAAASPMPMIPSVPSGANLGMLARGADVLALWLREEEVVSE